MGQGILQLLWRQDIDQMFWLAGKTPEAMRIL